MYSWNSLFCKMRIFVCVTFSVWYYKFNCTDQEITVHTLLEILIFESYGHWCYWPKSLCFVENNAFHIYYIIPFVGSYLFEYISWCHKSASYVSLNFQNKWEWKGIIYLSLNIWSKKLLIYHGSLVVSELFGFDYNLFSYGSIEFWGGYEHLMKEYLSDWSREGVWERWYLLLLCCIIQIHNLSKSSLGTLLHDSDSCIWKVLTSCALHINFTYWKRNPLYSIYYWFIDYFVGIFYQVFWTVTFGE